MAVDMWNDVREWFWDRSLWLPPNTTWEMLLDRTNGVYYPDFYDMWVTIPITITFLVARFVWERFVALPVGRYFKVSESRQRQARPNPLLEQIFIKHRKHLPPHHAITSVADELGWSTRQVERWWRRRKVQCKPSEMKRFKETSWRFLVYVTAFWSGLYILWDKPWLWDTKHFWYSYPLQHLPADCQWYYLIEMSFYMSLSCSLMVDIKRKDFTENVIHHVVTISLIIVSWTANMTRIGTVVLVTHDAVDWIMELAKLFNYIKWFKICDTLFVVFTVVWFLTRILFYPFWVIRSALTEGHVIIGYFTNIYYMYNGLLLALQILHIIWFSMILRMVYIYIVNGRATKDERSESDTVTDPEDDFVSYKPSPEEHQDKDGLSGEKMDVTDATTNFQDNISSKTGPERHRKTTNDGRDSKANNNNVFSSKIPVPNGPTDSDKRKRKHQ